METGNNGGPPRPQPPRNRTGPRRVRVGSPLLPLVLLLLLALPAVMTIVSGPAWAARDDHDSLRGRPLSEALDELRERGLPIVYTSRVVTPDLRVEAEPDPAGDARAILAQLLEPHGLDLLEGPDGTLVVVPAGSADREPGGVSGAVVGVPDAGPLAGARVRDVDSGVEAITDGDGRFELAPGEDGLRTLEARAQGYLPARATVGTRAAPREGPVEVVFLLEPSTLVMEEVVVVPSLVSLLGEEPTAGLGLTREQLQALPHLGDDIFRAMSLLPGISAGDVTARIQVRGGRRDETKILLDGQELYQAFHLRDYDDAASFVAPSTLAGAELSTGGFSATRGDRMGGVLDLTTREPEGEVHGRAGVGILGGQVGGGGPLPKGRGHWLAEVRRGSIGVVSQLLDSEDPRYWDAFLKGEVRLGERDSLRVHALAAGDSLDFRERIDADLKRFHTDYRNTHLWLTHQRIVGADHLLTTAGSTVRMESDRVALETEETGDFQVDDRRDSDIGELRQSVDHRVGRHEIAWGWRVREIETRIDYDSSRRFETPLASIRGPQPPPREPPGADVLDGVPADGEAGRDDPPPHVTSVHDDFRSTDSGLYLTDRVRLTEAVTLEAGLRWDRHSSTDQAVWSPRLGLVWRLEPSTLVRAAWGLYHQSHRPFELQAEDGETTLQPVERSEHRILGLERRLPGGYDGILLRIEAYRKVISDPRARWENLFEPINTFPEVEPERVLFAPSKSRAEGIELFLQGQAGERLLWWVNYALAATEDRLDGRWTRRLYDQRHAFNLALDLRLGHHWRLGLAWRLHSGWPTTPIRLEEVEDDLGESTFVPVLGPLNSERLPVYHRLDLRLVRSWRVGGGELVAFLDLQNVYDRRNVGGFDFQIDDQRGTLGFELEEWPGFVPSAGLRYEF